MRLCSYIVKYDLGVAPNPFGEYCTLAICTPNHMGVKLNKGDWIMGTETAARGNKLIYAMKVDEVLSFDRYYNDPRFEYKKPRKDGTWVEQSGDNMYFKDETGVWRQHPTIHHTSPEDMKKDLRYPKVFIAKWFYYFGKNAVPIPEAYQALIKKGKGCICDHKDMDIVDGFLNWLQQNFKPGRHGEPHDRPRGTSAPISLSFS